MDGSIWLTIVGAAIGTIAIRGSFVLAAERAAVISPSMRRVLHMIPPAALAAIVALELVDPHATTAVPIRLVAASAAAMIAWRRENLVLALAIGMAVVVGWEAVV